MGDILVVAEHRGGQLAAVSLEMLSKGRELANHCGGQVAAVVIGKDADRYARRLAQHADTVVVVDHHGLEDSPAEPSQRVLSSIVSERKPKLVLMGHTSFAMDLAPALAVELGAALATDCLDVSARDGVFRVTTAPYNGKVRAVYAFAPSDIIIVTGRAGSFPVEQAQGQGDIEVLEYDVEQDGQRKVFEGYVEPEASDVDIAQAKVVVSVGRGIKDSDKLELAEELASALGGVVACSRPIVDYGWLPAGRQVGQSGKTVTPKLYVALGISGAFQHVVGLTGAKMIVAVNKDPHAPIFGVADYGIVGDLFEVVPALTQKVRELKA
ncbi:MAG: electron transfer flavoprotein subunit alpha/FixB family protein [Chloroflexota bacterium]|nr:electron transfer flavoprotein subunit alpha/FixB family protein [Chloroflexota bacterium]